MRLNRSNERRGIILMVVLALLTLFAIVGITFVLYAQAQATSARIAREGETAQRADMPPEECLALFLGQFLYDVNDDMTGVGSGLRGHSLARTMYGYNSTTTNITPFNGVGRLHTNGTTWPYMNHFPGNPHNVDDHLLVNYTWFSVDGFVRDPEWYTGGPQTSPGAAKASGTGYYVGGNAPYTYPDLNNFFLAAVRSDGTVLTPSFHRKWLFNPNNNFNDMTNVNWTNSRGKYMTLRPRPADNLPINGQPGFPAPDDATGDVKNLVWAPGGNDSIWIDIGAPVQTAPDGTKYKMMVAPLIMDLDNRINVATAGNLEGLTATPTTPSRSNQGWFPSEVNLGYILPHTTTPTSPPEWRKLFIGNGSYYGKYGPNGVPSGVLFPAGSAAHVYAPADLNGCNESGGGTATAAIQLPGGGASAPANSCFPYFPQGYGSGSAQERTNHPAGYAAYKSSLYSSSLPNDDLAFRPSDMERLLRPSGNGLHPVDTGSAALISMLQRLCPQNLELSASAYQRRNWITTVSNDLAKPGLSPWSYNPSNPTAPSYSTYVVNPLTPTLPPSGLTPTLPTSGGAIPFPALAQRTQPLPTVTDFTPNWRAVAATLGRIDLNRPLPPYPHMTSGSINAIVGTNQRFDTAPIINPLPPAVVASNTATLARQQFATDIYLSLLTLTGVAPPSNLKTPTAADLAPRRWLAQLATNIVDYIDADEISTPFNFYNPNNIPYGNPLSPIFPGTYNVANYNYQLTSTASTIPPYPTPAVNPDVPAYWVYGTELPRLVINEVLGEYTLLTNNLLQPTALTGAFNVKLWVELFNPMPAAVNPTATANNTATFQPIDSQPVPLYHLLNGANLPYNPYQLVIANNNLALNSHGLWAGGTTVNGNVLGTPQHERFSPTGIVAGCNFASALPTGKVGTVAAPAVPSYPITQPGGLPGQSYMIVGPQANDVHNDITVAAGVPGGTPFLISPNMQYTVTYHAVKKQWQINNVLVGDNLNGVSVLLRRLANPHLPANPYTAAGTLANPLVPPNPYVTVDYLHGIRLNGYGMNKTPLPVRVSTFSNLINPIPPNDSPRIPSSYGKLQPYAANFTQVAAQNVPRTGTVVTPTKTDHTLGLPNSPLASPFTWLVHLDRKLISPMELLHVSGFPNHDLTQRFISPATIPNPAPPPAPATIPNPQLIPQPYNYLPAGRVPGSRYFQHYVPWFDQTRRLYRLFELLEAHDGASGVSPVNGRMPGKININTLWDLPLGNPSITPPVPYPQMYHAIADPPVNAANADNPNFVLGSGNVAKAFQKLIALRTPGLLNNPPTLTEADRPFLGMGAGVTPIGDVQYPATFGFPAGNGINHTLLTSGVASTPPTTVGTGAALQLPNTTPATPANPQTAHPYLQNELLTKVYNNFTTRSNVFAVFLTVGFFQVTNAATSPPTLGAEIGRSEGRQVRHRMFAIVDRTNMSTFTTASSTTVKVAPSPSSPQPWTIQVPSLSGVNPNTGAAWSIAKGTLLVIEPGTVNEETVIVTGVNPMVSPPTITANFLLAHPNPAVTGNPSLTYAISQRGNPGPWIRYDPRQDPGVVLYYNIID